jgi:acyl-CoA synthetase (AMP-forming)/AMP-acid ligase II/acyl carrier protein
MPRKSSHKSGALPENRHSIFCPQISKMTESSVIVLKVQEKQHSMQFCDVVDQLAEAHPSHLQMAQLGKRCHLVGSITRIEMERNSVRLAAHLLRKGLQKGDSVMLMFPVHAVIDYMTAFLACMRLGIVVISIYPPNPAKLDTDLKKFQNFLENSGATVAITTQEYKRFVSVSTKVRKWPNQIKEWIAADELAKKNINAPLGFRNAELAETDPVLIQYTSGSTSEPKGVVIHYGAFMAGIRNVSKLCGAMHGLRSLVWCPIYHDYGLFSNLAAMYSGTIMYVLDPLTFIQNPLLWLQGLEQYQINITNGPPFGFALTTKRLIASGRSFDLSSLTSVNLGAEPITQGVIQGIRTYWKIPDEVISHGYGFAEACLCVSSTTTTFDEETGLAICSDAKNQYGFSFLIASKEKKVLSDGKTGTIFVQGPSLSLAYYRNPEKTKEAFQNQFQGYEGYWYNTGDLGFLRNGRLVIAGRVKDVIIVNGKNIYATDIERSIESLWDGIIRPGCSAAFQLGPNTAAILCELKPDAVAPSEASIQDVKRKLDTEFGIQFTDILVCQKGTVPKTTSGKLQRSRAKEWFEAGKIQSISQLSQIETFASFDALLKSFGVQDMSKTLVENGIDSLKLTQLIDAAKQQFSLSIDFSIANEVPCQEIEGYRCLDSLAEPSIPAFALQQDKKMPHSWIAQLAGSVAILMVLLLCILPPAHLLVYLQSLKYSGILFDPILTIRGGPGLIYIILVVFWMLCYSVFVIMAKWTLIGKYQTSSYTFWSWHFYRWWLVDRLVDVWERLVGVYFLDTPYINVFYRALGVKTGILNVRFKCFVRDFDLLRVEGTASLSGMVLCRTLDKRGLALDHVVVKEGTNVKGFTVTYPGDVLVVTGKEENLSTYESMSTWLQIQRIFLPINFILINSVALYLFGVISSSFSKDLTIQALRYAVIYFGLSGMKLIFSGILVRLAICDFTADKIATRAYGALDYWICLTQWTNLLHIVLYGGKVDFWVQMNSFYCIAPSLSKYVTIGRGSTVSHCSISASKGQPVVLKENVTVGILANIQANSVVERNSVIGALSIVPKQTEVSENQAFFSSDFRTDIPTNQHSYEPSMVLLLKQLVVKFLFIWIPASTTFALAGFAAVYVHRSLNLPFELQILIVALTFILVYVFLFASIDIGIARIVVPNCANSSTGKVSYPLSSWGSTLYISHITQHRAVRANVFPFIKGTFLVPLYARLCGAQIQDITKLFMYGNNYDYKNLIWESNESQDGFTFVSDEQSIFEAHKLEAGVLTFEMASATGRVSLHPMAVAFGQDVDNATIGKRSRVCFQRNVERGFYLGMPSKRCSNHK